MRGEERIEHSMQFPITGIQKGIKTILIERGKHKTTVGHELIPQCAGCRDKWTEEVRDEALANGHINLHCCASYVLSHEPDFEEQEEWLTQVVHQAGFEIIFIQNIIAN